MDPRLYEAAMNGDMTYFQGDLSNLHKKKTPNQETVLHIATEFHQTELANFFVEQCPLLLCPQNSLGETALHIAAREGHSDMVRFFLSHAPLYDSETGTFNSQTRTLNKKNDTALHCAARSGGSKCVELLVKKDSEVCTWLNNANESPLYLSIVSRLDIDPGIILNNPASLEYHKGQNGLTELHAAVLKQNQYPFDSIQKLVEWKKEMLKEGDDLGMTPLHYAAFHGRIREVKLFVENDPSAIYCLNQDGQSALYVAALNGRVNVFKELVKCCPDCCNIFDNKGRTALHAAVLGNQHGVVEFVLKTSSLVRLSDMVDKDGNTPLHLAACYRSFEIIKSFERNEKTRFVLNHDSFTPFDVYRQHLYELDVQQLKDQDYENIIAAGSHLHSAKGVAAMRQLANEKLKMTNLLEPSRVEEKNINELKKKKGIRHKESVKLMAMTLVATVTFAAAITVPGGLLNSGPNEGLPIFADNPNFQGFVFFNTLAFNCSFFALFIHFSTLLAYHGASIYNKELTTIFTSVSITAMWLAFVFATFVVLRNSIALSLLTSVIPGSIYLLYPFSRKFIRLMIFGRVLYVPPYV